jgi:hypothetical protein
MEPMLTAATNPTTYTSTKGDGRPPSAIAKKSVMTIKILKNLAA